MYLFESQFSRRSSYCDWKSYINSLEKILRNTSGYCKWDPVYKKLRNIQETRSCKSCTLERMVEGVSDFLCGKATEEAWVKFSRKYVSSKIRMLGFPRIRMQGLWYQQTALVLHVFMIWSLRIYCLSLPHIKELHNFVKDISASIRMDYPQFTWSCLEINAAFASSLQL